MAPDAALGTEPAARFSEAARRARGSDFLVRPVVKRGDHSKAPRAARALLDDAAQHATPLARWVAAYALEMFGSNARTPLRLETLSGGPSEFRFSAVSRVAPPRSRAPAMRESVTEGELVPSEG